VSRYRRFAAVLALCAAGAQASPAALAAGDPARGEKLHADCVQCHGTRLYLPENRKIQSLRALEKEVRRWGDYYDPKLTEQEVKDLVAYLNRDFYRF
jgi:mono/diheme cytochrome c family protein